MFSIFSNAKDFSPRTHKRTPRRFPICLASIRPTLLSHTAAFPMDDSALGTVTFVLMAAVYLFAFSTALALCAFAGFRHATIRRIRHVGGRAVQMLSGAWSPGAISCAAEPRAAHTTPGKNRFLPVLLALLVVLPSASLLAARRWVALDGYGDTAPQEGGVIASLLAGERLSPPQPLPPEVFTTREVLAERPFIASASRDWSALDDGFSQRLLQLFQRMRSEGYEMVLLEGYRSPERQQRLAEQGENVTRAGANQSYHQFGLAADCAFLRNGRVVISERDPWAMRGYSRYGELAEELGLTWGGRWTLMDFGHVELRGTLRRDAQGGLTRKEQQ